MLKITCTLLVLFLSACGGEEVMKCVYQFDCPDDYFCSTVKHTCEEACTTYGYDSDDCPSNSVSVTRCLYETRAKQLYRKCVSEKTFCAQTCAGCCYAGVFGTIVCIWGSNDWACGKNGVDCKECASDESCSYSVLSGGLNKCVKK